MEKTREIFRNRLEAAKSETEKINNALQERDKQYHEIFESIKDVYYRTALNGEILLISPSIKDVSGYDASELIGRSVLELYKDPAAREKLVGELEASGQVTDYEVTLKFKNGREIISSVTARLVCGDEGQPEGFAGVMRDISEKKRLQTQLQKSQKMESLGLLAGGVAHDLNNVLSGIVSYPELLLMDLPGDSKLRKPLETMQQSGLRAAAIVQDLLTMARGVATTNEPLNLNDAVREYLSSPEFTMLKQYYPTVSVKTTLDPDLLNIGASQVHIRKVIMNLVSNAAEAIKESGNITISTRNRYVDKPLKGYDEINKGDYVVFSVSDNGSGISSDDLERIFEPFYTKKKMGRSGTGLGLSVVWNVMQDHKGYIDVATGGNGTTFELYFPITRDALLKKEIPFSIKDCKGNGETILVVDDVESQREISCRMLDTLGYNCKAVSGGEQAVDYLKKNSVDLVLLDMIMDPGINGHETYKRIIKIHPGQKAIIVSGFSETEDVKKTQALGAGKYIKKPLTLEKIGLAVKEELRK